MFLLRSAFWLTIAFVVINPGTDLGASAGAFSAQAYAAGQHVLVREVLNANCTECAGEKALLALAGHMSAPSVELPMQDSSTSGLVPLPRPRPDRMG